MHELDLIPDDYRRIGYTRRILKSFGLIYLLLMLSILSGRFFLEKKTHDLETRLSALEQQEKLFNQQQFELEALIKERDAKKKELAFVGLLEQGGGVADIFVVFDRVMGKKIWLTDWAYQELKHFNTSPSEGTGHESKNPEKVKIKLIGQAMDNDSLSNFVSRLLEQPEFNNVKVNKTAMNDRQAATVNFDMDIF